jgi:hypothetical protein
MGKLARFHCSVCGFAATTSGGDGQRFDNPSVTLHCHDCKQLFEVALPVVPWGGEIVIRSNAIQCPRSGDHQVEKWKHPGPCPKCGTELDREEIAQVPDTWPEGM